MPEMTEMQIYEAMGVGEKERESAEPAPEASQQSGQDGEERTGSEESSGAGREEPGEDEGRQSEQEAQERDLSAEQQPEKEAGGEKTPGQPQTEQQRRDHAAQRRREEQKAAVDAAVQEAVRAEREKHQTEMDAFFASAELKNTITGEPITNMEQFQAWKQAFDAAKLQRDLKAGKLTPEGLQQVIEQTPAMQQVRQLARQQEQAAQQQNLAAAQARIDAEIREIHKLDPTISQVKDLLNMPTSREFYALVKKGNSFLDAFRLANYDRLTTAAAEAARQQAMNNARSKDHLTATAPKGAGAAQVPAADLAMFRQFVPGATEAEIQAYYNKYRGG